MGDRFPGPWRERNSYDYRNYRPQKDYEQFINYLRAMNRKYVRDPVHIYIQGGLVFEKLINEYKQRDLRL